MLSWEECKLLGSKIIQKLKQKNVLIVGKLIKFMNNIKKAILVNKKLDLIIALTVYNSTIVLWRSYNLGI